MKGQSAFFLFAALAFSAMAQGTVPTLTVGTVDDFVKTIGSDRIIVLKAGTYSLSKAKTEDTACVKWVDSGDGKELVVHDVTNLTIRGEPGAALTADSRYANVLVVKDSRDIRIESIAAGHSKGGSCSGGVFRIETSRDVEIASCDLYGCGTVGLDIASSGGIRCSDTVIRECSYGAVDAERCFDLAFRNLTVTANDGCAVSFDDVSGSLFLESTFTHNTGSAIVAVEGKKSGSISFERCTFTANETDQFDGGNLPPELSDCSFKDNSFDGETGLGDTPEEQGFCAVAAGLGFFYGPKWSVYETESGGIYAESPDSGCIGTFQDVYEPGKQDNLDRFPEQAFRSAFKAIADASRKGSGVEIKTAKTEAVERSGGIVSQVYLAKASSGSPVLIGFHAYSGRIYAFTMFFTDEGMFETWEQEARVLIRSVTADAGGGNEVTGKLKAP